ncbi:hypothetical protein [Ralstonia phage RP13]|nr:hypothetical protein [Ralstonia phage RP13]
MHRISASNVTIAGKSFVLTKLDLVNNTLSTDTFSGTYHEVNLIDRSGSVYHWINDIVDTLLYRARAIRDLGGYMTVGWFSGPGQYKIVIKGAKVDDNVINILNGLRSTVGTTCFSEILRETADDLISLETLAERHVVNLMTDGQAVVRDVQAEIQASLAAAAEISDVAFALNTIGVGNYYNRKFLVDLAATTQYGRMIHLDDMRNNVFTIALDELTGESLNVLNQHANITIDQAGILLYTQGKVVVGDFDQDVVFAGFNSEDEEQGIFFLTDKPIKKMSVEFGGETADIAITKPVTLEEMDKLSGLYAYAYYAFTKMNNKKLAFDIVRSNIKDKHIATVVSKAFTHSELGEAAKILYDASFNTLTRYIDGKCGPAFMPASSFTSVLDVLTKLAQDDKAQYIPFHDLEVNDKVKKLRTQLGTEYKRATRKVTDTEDLFTKQTAAVKSAVDLVFAEDRLNTSIRFKVPGTVKLAHGAAKRVGLPQDYEAFLYRNHMIIKDGFLNVPMVEFIVDSMTTMHYLEEVNKKYPGFLKAFQNLNELTYYVMLDLKRIPLVRADDLEDVDVDVLVERTLDINNLEVKQKAVKYLIEDQEAQTSGTHKAGSFKPLTADQIQVLKDHGISHHGAYQGVNNVAPTVDNCDQYETREVYTYVKGFSSIPSRSAVEKKLAAGKTMTSAEQALFDALKQYTALIVDKKPMEAIKALKEELKTITNELLDLRNHMAAIKISTVLNNAWFNEIVLDEKDSAQLGRDVILKAKRVAEYI